MPLSEQRTNNIANKSYNDRKTSFKHTIFVNTNTTITVAL